MGTIRPKKSLGQHFLEDPNIIRKISSTLPAGPEDCVVEIGPGTGRLTRDLVRSYPNLIAVEIDKRAVELLRKEMPDLDVRHQDILKLEWRQFTGSGTPVHVVGNLPYYITSQILFGILEHRTHLASATLMMQKEVAERLIAQPGNKTYGILSVQVQLMSTPEILFDVSPNAFRPRPKVTSSVVRLRFDKGELNCSDRALKKVVRTAFQQRRKKLSNALKSFEPLPSSEQFDYDCRAENWPPETYEKLTAHLEQLGTLSGEFGNS